MNTYDLDIEIKAIKTLCGTNADRAGLLASLVRKEHFEDPRTQRLYARITRQAKRNLGHCTYDILKLDPALLDDDRELLQEHEETVSEAKTDDDARELSNLLERFRIARIMHAACAEINATLSAADADPYEGLQKLEDLLVQARSINTNDSVLKAGLGDNIQEKFEAYLAAENTNLIPTGFVEFDEFAGGFNRGALVVIAGTSGGGKSTMALQLGINALFSKHTTAMYSFEMPEAEMLNRYVANITEIDHEVIKKKRLSKIQLSKVTQKNAEIKAIGEKQDTFFHIRCPAGKMTINQIALAVKPLCPDFVIIDYIKLLDLEQGKNETEAQALGRVAKTAKLLAQQQNNVWVLLAQFDERGFIRYAREMKEHADNLWCWVRGDSEKATRRIEIEQQKSRGNEPRPFTLVENFSVFRFENPIVGEDVSQDSGITKTLKTVAGVPKSGIMPGLGADDEDDL